MGTLPPLSAQSWNEHFTRYQASPEFLDTYINYGNALLFQGRVEEAAEKYKHVLSVNNNSFDAHHNMALALARLGEFDPAIYHLREALRINPTYKEARENLSKLLKLRA